MSNQLVLLAVGALLLDGCSSSVPTVRPAAKSSSTGGPIPVVTSHDNADEQAVGRLGGVVARDQADPANPIVELNLNGASATDSTLKGLAALNGLKRLKTLYLVNQHGVTDAGLKEIAHWRQLQRLNLEGTTVTD